MTLLAHVHAGQTGQKGRQGALPHASAAEIRSSGGGGLPPAPRLPSRQSCSLYHPSGSPSPTTGCGRATRRCCSWDLQGSSLTNNLPLGTAKHVSRAVPLPSSTLRGGELLGRQKGISPKHSYSHSTSASATAHAGPMGLASSQIWTVQPTHMMLGIHVICKLLLQLAIPQCLGLKLKHAFPHILSLHLFPSITHSQGSPVNLSLLLGGDEHRQR